MPLAAAGPFLELVGIVLGGQEMAGAGEGDPAFLRGKLEAAHYYAAVILPAAMGLARSVSHGAEAVAALSDDAF